MDGCEWRQWATEQIGAAQALLGRSVWTGVVLAASLRRALLFKLGAAGEKAKAILGASLV